jgi:hypothetical protein
MKKALIIIGIVLGSILLLSGSFVGLLHLKSVQTYIIGKITDRISKELNIEVQVKQFHYRPLSHLTVDEIYLSDQQKDTLAYIKQIDLEFDPLQLREKNLNISHLTLKDPYLNIHTLPDSTLNCQFLLKAFQTENSTFPLRVAIDQLALEQTRLRYNEFLVDQINLSLTLPVLSQDSLDVYVESMHLRAQVDKIDAVFEADLHGSLDSIFADSLHLKYKGKQLYDGNFAVYHPTSLDSLYIQAKCNHLYCDSALLMSALSELNLQKFKLPKPIARLKYIEYSGDIKGRIENMLLHGSFKTQLGVMNVNGTLKADTTLQNLDFCGRLSTPTFLIGQMLQNKDLDKIAFDAHIDGHIANSKFKSCEAQAEIQQIDYKRYSYKNIKLNGKLIPNEVHGIASINDKNIKLNISGLADWDRKSARLDLKVDIDDFSPNALNLTKSNPELRLGATTYISLSTHGNNREMLDNLSGYVIFDSINLANNTDEHLIKQLKVLFDSETQSSRQLRIQSDMVTGSIYGNYNYSSLPIVIKHILHQSLPDIIDKPKQAFPQHTNLDFYVYLRRIDELKDIFNFKINIPSYPAIKGYIHNKDLKLMASIPQLETKTVNLEDITIAINNDNKRLNLSLYALTHLPQHNPTVAKLGDIKTTFQLSAANNNLDLDIHLGNTDSVRNGGNISITSTISEYLNKPKFDIQIKPTNIILNDSIWTISPTKITYAQATKSIDIHNLKLNTNYQSIIADGRISKEVTDSLDIQLNNINVNYLLTYTDASKVISIQGPVTGTATMYSVLSEMMLEAQASIKEGGINGVYLGDVSAEAQWDNDNKSIHIEGNVIDSTKHEVAIIQGKVIPKNKEWLLDINCDSVDIGFINHWTEGIISNASGRGYGKVQVRGKDRLVNVTGAALAKDASVTVPQIGVTYYFSDTIYLDPNAIRFPNIKVHDQYNNTGYFTGSVNHSYFTNITFDLRAEANKLLVMNLPADKQSFFYGKVYGTGDVHIHGDEKDCYIDVNAKTEADTKFYLNIYSASQASQSNFIDFVQPDTTSYGLLRLLNTKSTTAPTEQSSRLRLSLAGEVTPQAEISINLEGDDVIKGTGEGNLKLTYEYPSENVQMQGSYTLQSGLFSFSLGNIVRRNFTIREGSRITWESDPMSPTLDITGHYHTTASLRDLFGSESAQIATNRTSVPVNCVLHMKDQLFNPTLNFAIELPQSDESVQSQVNSMINTDEMLMRQMIYLLVFNRFYTPEYLQNSHNVGVNETYSLLSSTVTGQINSWLSKLTDVVTMGFNFRTDGEGETASQEYEANFQINPINQLIINGNFGYRYNDLSNRPFFGDLDIEYLLTENGKFRVKAYTHTVDKYSLRQANMVQGVGFVFKHDFNWQKSKKAKIKKEDSTNKGNSKVSHRNKKKN